MSQPKYALTHKEFWEIMRADPDERDRLWRAAKMRRDSGDPRSSSYVPEFAKGKGK